MSHGETGGPGIELLAEAFAAMLQRPSRLFLTALGVAVGIASLVATVGLTATASAQIGSDFNALLATQVGVGGANGNAVFRPQAESVVDALPGVRASGVWYVVDENVNIGKSGIALVYKPVQSRLVAAGPGYLAADDLTVIGDPIGPAFQGSAAPVADIGIGLGRQIGINSHDLPAVIYADGRVITVIGLIGKAPSDPGALASIVVPESAANSMWGKAGSTTQSMIIRTNPGAAQVVAAEVAAAIDPTNPSALVASAPPDPGSFRAQIQGSVSSLFLGLAAVALAVGGLGIANMTLVAVLERTAEIGLRRAIGAKRRHILLQFVLESGLTGLLGGITGSCIGLMITVGVAYSRTWTVTLPSWLIPSAPAIGLIVGVLAGLYPALRAASVEPVEALRR
jgi:putative ABC transport system permease protein